MNQVLKLYQLKNMVYRDSHKNKSEGSLIGVPCESVSHKLFRRV